MALGQKYSILIGDGKTSMYFWAQNDAEALNLVKHHKFTIYPRENIELIYFDVVLTLLDN